LGDEKVGDVAEQRDLVGDGADDCRVAGAERADGDAAEEVEVLLAVGVPQPGALAVGEGDAGGAVVVHQGGLPPPGQFLIAHQCASSAVPPASFVPSASLASPAPPGSSGTTMVPMPSSVKISSRMECWTRPSMTRAVRTPLRTAYRQPSILGTMPLARSGRSCSSSLTVSRLMTSSL